MWRESSRNYDCTAYIGLGERWPARLSLNTKLFSGEAVMGLTVFVSRMDYGRGEKRINFPVLWGWVIYL